MDPIDKKLIDLLVEDAQQTKETLAKKLGIDVSTVRRRTKKLIENGALRINALPDPRQIGFPLRAVIAFDVAEGKLSTIMKSLSKRPEVKWVVSTSGRFDILAIVWFPSTDELFQFVDTEVGNMDGIRNTETFICLHVEKGF